MFRKLPFLFLFSCICYALIPIEQVQKELSEAEKDFQRAKEMFNPWYGGPLLTGSANTLDPGYFNMQPYLYVIDNYAAYDSERKSHSIPTLININPLSTFQAGIYEGIDTIVTVQGFYKTQSHHSAGSLGDTTMNLAFRLLKETPYFPGIKISVTESFPTGKYQKLSPEKGGIDGTGSGAYKTSFGLNFGKVLWMLKTHPMNLRLAFSYGIPAKVKVREFNAYGGGFGTDGKAKSGNVFLSNFGYEFSITQKFVFALDVSYEYDNKSTFHGISGFTKDGDSASLGGPSSDFLSLAPALEYNFTSDLALIAGAWFSVYGRNTNNFAAGIVTVTVTF